MHVGCWEIVDIFIVVIETSSTNRTWIMGMLKNVVAWKKCWLQNLTCTRPSNQLFHHAHPQQISQKFVIGT
jgi:hypothetical protein